MVVSHHAHTKNNLIVHFNMVNFYVMSIIFKLKIAKNVPAMEKVVVLSRYNVLNKGKSSLPADLIL